MIDRSQVLTNIAKIYNEFSDPDHYISPFNTVSFGGIKFNDSTFFGEKDILTIILDEVTYLTPEKITFYDEKVGGELFSTEYREMTEEGFFQLTTLQDMGDLTYSDLQFIISKMPDLIEKSVHALALIRKNNDDHNDVLVREITQQIDNDILNRLKNMTSTITPENHQMNWVSNYIGQQTIKKGNP